MDGREPALTAGQMLGRWRIEGLLGAGAMGEVYRARTQAGRAIALKVLHPDVADDPAYRRLFLREVRAVARLRHPNLVGPLDYGEHEGRPWLAMELIEGVPLSTWRERLPAPGEILRVMDQILAALAHAHARGVVHRDLKPENVLLETLADGSLRARVMDFGIARVRTEADEEEEPARMAGTPAYMAPEQGLGAGPLLPLLDLYAVGVMLWELVSGGLPHRGETPMAVLVSHARGERPPLRPRPGVAISPELVQLIGDLLARHPLDRPRFALEVRERLASCWIEVGGVRATGDAEASERIEVSALDAPARQEHLGFRPLGLFGLEPAPWTDRVQELALLGELAAQVLESGGPAAIVLQGEVGVGKSRLAEEFRASLQESACMQVWATRLMPGVASERGAEELLREGLGLRGLGSAQLGDECRSLLRRWGREDEREAEALHAFVDPSRGDAARLGEDARRALVGRVVRYSAREAPVCVVIDDAQHGDGTLLRWVLQSLREEQGGAPRLFVFVLRRGAQDAAAERALQALLAHPRCSEVQVGPLPARSLAQLTRAALALPGDAAEQVAAHAGGNPFFALELLRHLMGLGVLEEREGEEDLSGVPGLLPEGLSLVLRRRLEEAAERHGPDRLRIWSRLAFLGERFPAGLAQHMLALEGWEEPERALDAALAAAAEAGIIEDSDESLYFQHPLLAETLRNEARSLGRDRDRALLAARARESYWADALDAHAAEIGRDFARAGAHGRAAEYFRRGALHAMDRQRYREALLAWRGAEASEARRVSADIQPFVEAQIGVGEAALKLGDLDALEEALDRVDRSISAAGRPLPPAAARLRGVLELRRGNTRTARSILEDAVRGFLREDDERGVARAFLALGRLELSDGRIAAAEQALRESLARWERVRDGFGEAATLIELAVAALLAGLGDEARALIEKALYRYLQHRDPLGMARCAQVLGQVAMLREDHGEAHTRLTQAAAEFEELGAVHEQASALLRHGRAAQALAKGEEAGQSFARAEHLFAGMGDRTALATTALCRASLLAEAHDWVGAREAIEEALARDGEERNDDPFFVELLTAGAREAIFGGEEELALRMLETVRFKLERHGDDSPLYDRLDEVQYLIHELRGEGEPTGPLPQAGGKLDDL